MTAPNAYQQRKARTVASSLLRAACEADYLTHQLAETVAGFSDAQWRSVSFANGLPVLDTPARVFCVALLLGLA